MRRRFARRPRNSAIMPMLVVIVLAIVWLLATNSIGQSTSVNQAGIIEDVVVHVLDVGQADSILIQWPTNHAMLIDGGNRDDGRFIAKYLEQAGVQQLDCLIATHPHEDHIGGLPYIIEQIPVKAVYMPEATANTKIYEDLLDAIKDKGLRINIAKAGLLLPLDGGISAAFLAPAGDKYEDLNQYSAVLKIQYGQARFLFMGDAGLVSEQQMLKSGQDLTADVVKIGHHGSADATSEEFLDAVRPRAAVISVGRDNDYGHPDQFTLDKLAERNIAVYRTDKDGIITFMTDGKDIEVGTSRSDK
ncbi:ComEC/Rec2 family competence protein [Mahella sp.]|uniref:ComEC/Rec2 family competence protein n=1 Tax=Mahella sp. TaxID=2798721 RepID=UPI0025BB3AB4|nr:ComEC/Rec2 family competence protein [Mahella sp.]MBZ4666029.1 beta-lactamase domain protein [Mahella sp.]